MKRYMGYSDRVIGYADLETRFSSYNTKAEGLAGDTVIDDYALLNALANVTMQPAGGRLDIIGAPRVGTNITFPKNVTLNFVDGAYLAPDGGIKVTINGRQRGALRKRFGGGGTFVFGKGTATRLKPEWWGADGDDAVDSTIPFQNCARDACATALATDLGATIMLGSNSKYKVTSTITTDQHRVRWDGAGTWSSTVSFVPTAADICFFFGRGGEGVADGGVLYEVGLRNIRITSPDTVFKKTAIEVKNISGAVFEKINVGPIDQWKGADSIGLRTRGREVSTFRDLALAADKPLVLGLNPLAPNLCTDHFTFTNLYLLAPLTATVNACITVEDGVVMSNTAFDGHQAWVGGKYGFYWVNTVAPSTSNNVSFKNARIEQNAASPGGYMFFISSNANILDLSIDHAFGGTNINGYYFRGCPKITLRNCWYVSAALEAINTDATVGDLSFENCFWQTGATSALNGMRQQWALPSTNSSVLPSTAAYTSTNNLNRGVLFAEPIYGMYEGGVANNGIVALGDIGLQGKIVVMDSEGLTGEFVISPFGARVTELTDPSGVFSAVAATAASTNVYWDAGSATYKLENKRGNPRSYRIAGAYVTAVIT